MSKKYPFGTCYKNKNDTRMVVFHRFGVVKYRRPYETIDSRPHRTSEAEFDAWSAGADVWPSCETWIGYHWWWIKIKTGCYRPDEYGPDFCCWLIVHKAKNVMKRLVGVNPDVVYPRSATNWWTRLFAHIYDDRPRENAIAVNAKET